MKQTRNRFLSSSKTVQSNLEFLLTESGELPQSFWSYCIFKPANMTHEWVILYLYAGDTKIYISTSLGAPDYF